jgi:predicted negative regulator of RcsB-dependent stress response
MKRVVRRQLKEDEFVSVFNKAVHYIREHTRQLINFFVAIVILAVIILGANFISRQNLKKESQLLSQILELQTDLNEKPENLAKLEELAGGGKFSRMGYTALASYWIENGDLDKAQNYLEEFPQKNKDVLFYQAQNLLAQVHFLKKEYEKAIEIYRDIEEENPGSYSLEVVLFHRAEVHEEMGETDEALALYRRIQEEYSQTYYGFDASQKIRELESKK